MTGAGILLVEESYRDKGPAIILYISRGTRKAQDLGGSTDRQDQGILAHTAKREAAEESAGYLRFVSLDERRYVDVGSYRAYVVGVPSHAFIRTNALLRLKQARTPHTREMIDVKRVYLSDLLRSNILHGHGDITTVDADGIPIKLRGRTKAVVRKGLVTGIFQPIKLDNVFPSTHGLLITKK